MERLPKGGATDVKGARGHGEGGADAKGGGDGGGGKGGPAGGGGALWRR
jgi:hypothetical protein